VVGQLGSSTKGQRSRIKIAVVVVVLIEEDIVDVLVVVLDKVLGDTSGGRRDVERCDGQHQLPK
jgi:hypothetical protein